MKYIDSGTTLRCGLHLHDLGIEDSEPLRGITADFFLDTILDDDSETSTLLGTITGWVCWRCLDSRMADAGDALNGDVHCIAFAAEKILKDLPWADGIIEDAVLIDRVTISPEFRGQGYLPFMIDELVSFLRLDANGCILVTQPEPQKPEGGPYRPGDVRDRAMAGLCRSLDAAGFSPWVEGPEVWWRPAPGAVAGIEAGGMVEEPNSEEAEEDVCPDLATTTAYPPHQPKRAFIDIEAEVVFTDEQAVIAAALNEMEGEEFDSPESAEIERLEMVADITSALMRVTDIVPVDGAWDAIEINATTKTVRKVIPDSQSGDLPE